MNLPEDRQWQVIKWCKEPKSETCPGGYEFAQEQLAADGIKVSERALSQFFSDFQRKLIYEEAYESAESQKSLMLDFDPSNVDRAEAFGDYCFLQKAVQAQDPKTFVMLGNLRETRKSREQRAAFDKRKLAQKDRQIEQKDKQIAQKDQDLEMAERKLAAMEEEKRRVKAEVEKLRNPAAGLSDTERDAIIAKVDEILGIKH